MKKEVIDADNYKFIIKVMPHGEAYGVFIIGENYPNDFVLTQAWTVQECKNWIFSHFIGEKGTTFNVEIHEGKIVEDENGLHLEEE